jgi:hypothetical protein
VHSWQTVELLPWHLNWPWHHIQQMKQVLTINFCHARCIEDKAAPAAATLYVVAVGLVLMMMMSNFSFDVIHITFINIIANEQTLYRDWTVSTVLAMVIQNNLNHLHAGILLIHFFMYVQKGHKYLVPRESANHESDCRLSP